MSLDQLSVLKLVTGRLDAAGIPYMITGSIAAGHYAQPRFTRDIDLVVELQPSDAERLAELFDNEFECDVDAIRTAIARQSLFNLIHIDAIVKVDFLVRKSTPYREEEFRRRRRALVDGQTMWMVSPGHRVVARGAFVNDTAPEIEARLTALLAQRSGSDRVRMVCEMFDLARALMVGRVKAEEPEISAEDLRTKIFERTYADDFNSEDRARIVARLRG